MPDPKAQSSSDTVRTRVWTSGSGADAGDGACARDAWLLAEETPVEIAVDGEPVAVVMATPIHLEDLVRGFLLTEGFVEKAAAIGRIALSPLGIGRAAHVTTQAGGPPAERRKRVLASRSGCGICGATRLDEAVGLPVKVRASPPVEPAAIARAFTDLAAHQPLNAENHSVHAAALARPDGTIVLAREDVGRHNALDKLVGALAAAAGPVEPGSFIVMSSRCSYELVQKASIAGVPLLATIGAPTTLAVETARAAGMKLAARGPEGSVVLID